MRQLKLFFLTLALGLISTLALISLPKTSFAHSVYVFAWADGAQICTESYYTQKNKVRGGEVHMLDSLGEILDRGFTDDDGLLCFSAPAKAQPLEFAVLAGAGHRGSFRLEEKDVNEAVAAAATVSATTGATTKTIEPDTPPSADESHASASSVPAPSVPAPSVPTPSVPTPSVTDASPLAGVLVEDKVAPASETSLTVASSSPSADFIRAIVREELQKQLSPMRQYLAEKLENTTPGPREIIGGMGWLAGLGALGFWFSQRRKKG